MPTEIKLPRLGQGMDEGKILKWLKSEGDTVTKGEEIYEVETEKVNMEVESPAAGVLLKIVAGEGDTVPIGTVIAWVGSKGESVPDAGGAVAGGASNGAASKDTKGAAAAAAKEPAAGSTTTSKDAARAGAPAPSGDQARQAPEGTNPAPSSTAGTTRGGAASAPAAAKTPSPQAGAAGTDGDRIKASPLARRIAGERGLDLGSLRGTGPDGRIIARDLEGVAAGAAAPAGRAAQVAAGDGGTRVELSSMRRTIARRLSEAWQAPVFYLAIDVDMTEANALRTRLVAGTAEGEVRPTVSDLLTKAAAVALRRVPDVNVHWAGDAIIRYEAAHVGMAVSTDNGLVVPVFRNAHARTIRELAAERKLLVDKARSGKLTMDDMSGGTFSISNLGMMGIDEFSAVLNPPETAIIAIGATVDTPVAIKGKVEIRPMMTITGTFDHRAIDGAVGARFLGALKEHLQDPLSLL